MLRRLPQGTGGQTLRLNRLFQDALRIADVPGKRGQSHCLMKKPDLSVFPSEPGVYLYKDVSGRILYVGKARRLRQRVASYFHNTLTPKTRLMLRHAETIDFLRTGTEKEALLLEASLIKKHRPRYNIVLRDDKEYLLFRISSRHPYPRLEIVRRNQIRGRETGDRLFGPFSSMLAARETWRLIHKHFPLRRCRDAVFANRTRPCLYHDMGQCPAPCVFPVDRAEYAALLDKVALFLSGKSRALLQSLHEEMNRASSELRFEDAARLRDQIRAVEQTLEHQSVVLNTQRSLDLIGVAQVPEGLALGVVFVRHGLLLDGRNYFWPGLSVEDTPELIDGFLTQYYLTRREYAENIPPRIVVPWLPGDADAPGGNGTKLKGDAGFGPLEAALTEIRGRAVHVSRPRDQDEDRLVLMAASNACEAVKRSHNPALSELLGRRLHAENPIRRIEAVDISHTGGGQTRAGMVVFEDGQPVPDAFRVYAFDSESWEAGDDYAALGAWAKRRAASGEPWPDLLLVDGGKGQLAAVHSILSAAGVPLAERASARTGKEPAPASQFSACLEGRATTGSERIVLASIAKARTEEGSPDRRAGNVSDRIFLPGRSNPLSLAPGSPELLFLQHVRDAAHDFVIGRHRRARAAATLSGELTRVPGVGPKLARLLFERFGSLAGMAEAGEESLTRIPGIGKVISRAIMERLSLLLKEK